MVGGICCGGANFFAFFGPQGPSLSVPVQGATTATQRVRTSGLSGHVACASCFVPVSLVRLRGTDLLTPLGRTLRAASVWPAAFFAQ